MANGYMYEKELVNDSMTYTPKTENIMGWSIRRIRHFLESVVESADKDFKKQSKLNKKLNGLAGSNYANYVSPLRTGYTINVGDEKEKSTLEAALTRLEGEARDKNSKINDIKVCSSIFGTPTAFGILSGYTAYLCGGGVGGTLIAGLITGIIGLSIVISFGREIDKYFSDREENLSDKIREKFGRIKVVLGQRNGYTDRTTYDWKSHPLHRYI